MHVNARNQFRHNTPVRPLFVRSGDRPATAGARAPEVSDDTHKEG